MTNSVQELRKQWHTISCCLARYTLWIVPVIQTLLFFKFGMLGSPASGNIISVEVRCMICFKLLLFLPNTILWCCGDISIVMCTWTWVCKQQYPGLRSPFACNVAHNIWWLVPKFWGFYWSHLQGVKLFMKNWSLDRWRRNQYEYQNLAQIIHWRGVSPHKNGELKCTCTKAFKQYGVLYLTSSYYSNTSLLPLYKYPLKHNTILWYYFI